MKQTIDDSSQSVFQHQSFDNSKSNFLIHCEHNSFALVDDSTIQVNIRPLQHTCAQQLQSLFLLVMHIEKSSQTVFTPLADGNGVLLNLETLFYYNLNRTGSVLWQQIEAGKDLTLDDLLRSTCEQFEVDETSAHQFISAFVKQLEQLNMIRVS